VYFDFGFLARRPRLHDISYALAFMVLALRGHEVPAEFDWSTVRRLVHEYEENASSALSLLERRALGAYMASVPLYFMACAGYTADPIREMEVFSPFMRLSEWILERRTANPMFPMA
jgi:hypothetical protein